MDFINLSKENINDEHICCAFSDKKCTESYGMKKQWLKNEFDNGYVFYRLNERAKVFIEYGPAEHAWLPVTAPDYLNINCFWVSGKYKKNGHGKALLDKAWNSAVIQNKAGLITVTGTKKFHFMSDGKWFQKQGFEECDRTDSGFSLLVKRIGSAGTEPKFNDSVRSGTCTKKEGLVVYYSNRCPYSEYHVMTSLKETAIKRNIPLTIVKLETIEQAQKSPSPATIFSLFYEGQFMTTDISVCMESRFDKILGNTTNKSC